jgi:hypothetical protein
MRFYDVSVNQSVPTEANRDLTSYSILQHQFTFISLVWLSGLGPKLTCIGAKLVETWQHVYLSFGQDGY